MKRERGGGVGKRSRAQALVCQIFGPRCNTPFGLSGVWVNGCNCWAVTHYSRRTSVRSVCVVYQDFDTDVLLFDSLQMWYSCALNVFPEFIKRIRIYVGGLRDKALRHSERGSAA
jgi:hypothetical protein